MNADTYELKTILTLERRYVVPTFQRDYEWTEDGQWALLFEDLEAVAARLEAGRRQAEAIGEPATKADKKVAPHFLGAIVLDLLPSSAGSLDLRSVIDGQQRLTTLQLLVRGILDELVMRESPRVPQVRRLIQNPSDVVKEDDERHKLWPRRRDRAVWRQAMADDEPAATGHLYLQARRFFRDRARTAMTGLDGSDRSEVVVDALLSLFKLVVIDLEDNDDAQVIFEVLNGRQTALSATDLVKNLLFLQAELEDEAELERLYDEHWAPFDDEWWRKEVGRGHAARGRRDVLLSTWLTAEAGTDVQVGHLYGEARKYLNSADRKIPDILRSLSASASAFRSIFERPAHLPPRMREAYARIDRLSVTTALPLLVWLRTLPPDHLSQAEHLRAVTAVDSWIVRRVLTWANTRAYGKRFLDVLQAAQAARDTGQLVGAAVESALLQGGGPHAWPRNEDVEAAFVGYTFYGVMTQERIRMVLGAIDAQLHREHAKGEQPTFDYDRLQIEHVLPQSWEEHWPVSADTDAERLLQAQVRERTKNRIGNLTLVTAPLNAPMSNGPWPMKRSALMQHSNLRLNALLTESDSWDEGVIEDRARDLAAVACRIWPRPEPVACDDRR